MSDGTLSEHRTLTLSEQEILTRKRHYIIHGVEYSGEFGLGVKPTADEAGTVEDLPDTVYDTLTDTHP